MPKPEQTEKATPKRREEARKRGQVAKSPDLAGAAIFLVGVFVLHASAQRAIGGLGETMRAVLDDMSRRPHLTVASVWLLFAQAFGGIGIVLALLFGAALLAGIGANVLQVGFRFTLQPLAPSFSKINPAAGIARLFSKQVAVNLLKQILKLAAVFVIVYTSVALHPSLFYRVADLTAPQVVQYVSDVVYGIAWKFGLLLLVVALLDYAYERWQFEENLKMTKQEVKDEWRQSEGSPEAKAAFKRRQREFARRRMMAAVPKATVVVTNPTHFSVALEWDEEKMEAPVVTAKGADLLAKRIREIAAEHGVPVMENAPLARTLYTSVELGRAIPPNLYAAVAQVIAFVFRLKQRTIA